MPYVECAGWGVTSVRICRTSGASGDWLRSRWLCAILSPLRTPGYRPVKVKLRDGRTLEGLAKNQRRIYDLQLQDSSGALHFFSKAQIAEETFEPKSLMPRVTGGESEMRDLLAFLTRLSTATPVLRVTVDRRGRRHSVFRRSREPKSGNWPTYNGRLRAAIGIAICARSM